MTELDLYRFCQNKEMAWRDGCIIMWLQPVDLDEFAKLLGNGFLCDEGLDLNLRPNGNIALELNEICEWFNIDIVRLGILCGIGPLNITDAEDNDE